MKKSYGIIIISIFFFLRIIIFSSFFVYFSNIYLKILLDELLCIFLPSLILFWIYDFNIKKELGFIIPNRKYFIFTFLLTFFTIFLIYGFNNFIIKIFPSFLEFLKQQSIILSFKSHSWYLSIPFLSIIPAFFEELFFRGILINLIDTEMKSISILFSSILFSLYHLNFYQFIHIFFLGVLLGYLYKFSKSIYPPMLMHFLINFFSILIVNLNINQF